MVHSFDLKGQEKEEGMKTGSIRGMSCFILGCLLIFLSGGVVQAQTEIWSYEQGGNGKAYSTVYGSDGNIYTTGSMGTGVGRDLFVVSLDDAGDEQWSYTHDGTASDADEGRTITYGEDDNVYVVGFTKDSTTLKDIAVISLDTLGNEQWFYTYDGTASGADDGYSIVYGADGNIYVAGFANNTGTGKDFVVISVDNTGNERWVYTYDGTASDNDEATSLIYGADGNIYAVGYSTETGHNKDFIVVSLDTTGDENWVYLYNGSSSNEDRARTIVYGSDGNLYAAGFSTQPGSKQDFTVIGLDVAGNEQWVYLYDGLYNGTVDADGAQAIIYGEDDNLYAAGYVVEEQSYNKDFAVISVDTAGSERWVYSRHGSGSVPVDMAMSLVYGSGDSIYVAGFIVQGSENDNIVVVSLDTLGQLNWFYKKDGGGAPSNEDQARSIAYDPDGYLYLAGWVRQQHFAVVGVYPGLLPAMWSYPSFIMVVADSGETVERELKISNIGEQECPPLEWSVTERPPVDWLEEDPTSGSIDAGDTVTITVTFDATELAGGIYYDTLEINTNDPVQPTKDVWVKLTVTIPGIEEHSNADTEDRCELLSSFFSKAISLRFTIPSDTPCEIVLYDVLGARVYETVLSSTPPVFSLDGSHISQLSHGVYFLSVSRSENVYPVMKLIKF
jgi:hypothetical protein